MARYYASVPAGSAVSFPAVCPFTGRPDPQSKVRLAKSAARRSSGASALLEVCLLVFTSFHFARTSTASVRVPADRKFAWKARLVEFAMWLCFLAALVALAVVFRQIKALQDIGVPSLWLGGATLATIFLKVWHCCLLRAVVLGESDDYFVEIGFLSENYAQEFASLNKVQLSES
jgi:hypothetical protein